MAGELAKLGEMKDSVFRVTEFKFISALIATILLEVH